ncbi:hypothetical protein K3495_g3298 [Podosphaera aphanis]|nr:hypothetical protein K3495_g3298 [Podosphaera aphanis]
MVMPFGLRNAPVTFQGLMEEILGELHEFTSGLLDDIAIWGDTPDELHKRTLLVFRQLAVYGMVINGPKSKLFVEKGLFLGFLISKEGTQADPAKLQAVHDRSMPTTTTQVRGFVNAAGYFRHLIKNYSKLAAPLTELTGGPKNQTIKLSSEAINAWHKIRSALTTTPVVKVFSWLQPIIIESDSSKSHVGAALLQPHLHGDKSVLHSIAYFSRKLAETQTRHASQERELLGIMLSLQRWKH